MSAGLDPYQRGDGSLERAFPQRPIGRDGLRPCCVCGDPLTGRRRRYCGDACAQEAGIRSGNTAAIRAAVFGRDRGVCAACGRDCHALEMSLSLVAPTPPYVESQKDYERTLAVRGIARKLEKAAIRQVIAGGFDSGFWQADHVTPVSEGGGGCDLDGFQTLCVPCHKLTTAALAARTAAGRLPQMNLFPASA